MRHLQAEEGDDDFSLVKTTGSSGRLRLVNILAPRSEKELNQLQSSIFPASSRQYYMKKDWLF
jgi:hypothetical protein